MISDTKWFLFALMLFACSSLQKKHEIPERREFPTDAQVAPCQDFYAYACNPVIDSYELREDRSRHIFSFSDTSERLLNKKKAYLHELAEAPSTEAMSKRAQELRDVFVACMDPKESAIEEKDYISTQTQTWTELGDRKLFMQKLADQIVSPYFSFVSFGRAVNQEDSNQFDLLLDSGTAMTLPERSYYDNAELTTELKALMTGFFTELGFEDASSRAEQVLAFETELAKVYPLPSEIRELYNEKNNISQRTLVKAYPNLHLEKVIKKIPPGVQVRHFLKPSYVWLNGQLQNAPLSQLQSVFLWHELSGYMDDAYPDFFKKRFAFYHKYLGGPPERAERKERCTTLVMGQFTKELDAELVEKIYPDFPAEKFKQMVDKVRRAMIRKLEKNTWLSAKGKKNALKKMQTTKMQLVWPETKEAWDFLPYADYSPNRPIANMHLRGEKGIEKSLQEMKKDRDRTKWSMGPLTVNAYYSPSDHKFVMPVGILQYPFYDPNLKEAINLGAAGMVVGHELGHAIDDQGAKYDEKGRLNQWMTDEDIKKFRSMAKKLIAQYDQVGHNGSLTQGENIADVTGLSFAYEAAFPENKGSGEDKKAFFLQYARLWCGKVRPKELERRLKTDPHAQNQTRVNLPLMHQDGFYEAYGCKQGQKMYLEPNERLKIW